MARSADPSSHSASVSAQPGTQGVPLGATGIFLLGLYFAAFGMVLLYSLCEVWPPQPWPEPSNARNSVTQPLASGVPGIRQGQGAAEAPDNGASQRREPTESKGADLGGVNPQVPLKGASQDGASETSTQGYPPPLYFFKWTFYPSLDVRLLLLVICGGALGSLLHATTSFADFAGNRTLVRSWVWWYVLRPYMGAALALLIYFLLRGGFMTGMSNPAGSAEAATLVNPFGIAALAGLAGLFAKQATDKLNEVFSTMFRPAADQGDAKRKDDLVAAKPPTIESIAPMSSERGAAGVVLTIKGANFATDANVRFDGTTLKPKTVNASEIAVEVEPALLERTRSCRVAVVNSGAGSPLESNEMRFEVIEPLAAVDNRPDDPARRSGPTPAYSTG